MILGMSMQDNMSNSQQNTKYFAEKNLRISVNYHLETHAEEGAGQPLVLVDFDIVVVIDGVAHDEGGSSVETGREVIDDGDTLVEKHVET